MGVKDWNLNSVYRDCIITLRGNFLAAKQGPPWKKTLPGQFLLCWSPYDPSKATSGQPQLTGGVQYLPPTFESTHEE